MDLHAKLKAKFEFLLLIKMNKSNWQVHNKSNHI